MTDEKKLEIKGLFEANNDLTSLEVMNGYIFGEYAENEHYMVEDIEAIRQSVINPPVEVIEEPVVEVPVEEII